MLRGIACSRIMEATLATTGFLVPATSRLTSTTSSMASDNLMPANDTLLDRQEIKAFVQRQRRLAVWIGH